MNAQSCSDFLSNITFYLTFAIYITYELIIFSIILSIVKISPMLNKVINEKQPINSFLFKDIILMLNRNLIIIYLNLIIIFL